MATPQSTTSYEAPDEKKLEQITFRFCSECSNMLYPKEDEDAHKLQFTCRTCQYTEDAQSTCVFRNVLNTSAGETAGVTQDVGSDPTVSGLAPVLCLGCGCAIACDTCLEPCDKMMVTLRKEDTKDNTNQESMSMYQFVLPLEDPFAEYDEEVMTDNATDNSDCDSEVFADDGAMVIDLA
jgi:DNA-directed RNA polymerase II subunit RPB9